MGFFHGSFKVFPTNLVLDYKHFLLLIIINQLSKSLIFLFCWRPASNPWEIIYNIKGIIYAIRLFTYRSIAPRFFRIINPYDIRCIILDTIRNGVHSSLPTVAESQETRVLQSFWIFWI